MTEARNGSEDKHADDDFFQTLLLIEAGLIDRDWYSWQVLANPVSVTFPSSGKEKRDGNNHAGLLKRTTTRTIP